jgi:uncharacterized membrane protein
MAEKRGNGGEGGGAGATAEVQRKAAIAALVSTVLLFALLLGGAWVGIAVYDALPMGPFPKSRLISSLVTILILLGGYIVYNKAVFGAARARGRAIEVPAGKGRGAKGQGSKGQGSKARGTKGSGKTGGR